MEKSVETIIRKTRKTTKKTNCITGLSCRVLLLSSLVWLVERLYKEQVPKSSFQNLANTNTYSSKALARGGAFLSCAAEIWEILCEGSVRSNTADVHDRSLKLRLEKRAEGSGQAIYLVEFIMCQAPKAASFSDGCPLSTTSCCSSLSHLSHTAVWLTPFASDIQTYPKVSIQWTIYCTIRVRNGMNVQCYCNVICLQVEMYMAELWQLKHTLQTITVLLQHLSMWFPKWPKCKAL